MVGVCVVEVGVLGSFDPSAPLSAAHKRNLLTHSPSVAPDVSNLGEYVDVQLRRLVARRWGGSEASSQIVAQILLVTSWSPEQLSVILSLHASGLSLAQARSVLVLAADLCS